MNKYLGIVESTIAPSKQYVWLNGGELRYFSNGKWTSINNKVAFENPTSGGAIIQTPVIKLGNTTEDKASNIEVCAKFSTSDIISIDIEGSYHGYRYDAIGIYHNGSVSILEGNKCTVFDIDFNTGEVTLDSKYDTSKFLPYVDLEIGNSSETKAYNLERLQTGVFFCSLDYGYGVGSWNPVTGGQATVVTSYNHAVHYTISNDGIVTKSIESPDLYFDYVNNGGTKTASEFSLALKDLIDL